METKKTSNAILWTSFLLQGIIVVMFLMGATMNLLQSEQAVAGAVAMGYPESAVFSLGVILLFATLLYAIPKTSVLGAVLLTAWLGGAVATHVIHRDPVFNLIFPIIFGILLWTSIWLRDKKLRTLVPISSGK